MEENGQFKRAFYILLLLVRKQNIFNLVGIVQDVIKPHQTLLNLECLP